jgi:hypothetical protein
LGMTMDPSTELGGAVTSTPRGALAWRRGHVPEALPQRLVDEILHACAASLAQPLDQRGHILIQSQGRTHASKRTHADVLMLNAAAARDNRVEQAVARHGPRPPTAFNTMSTWVGAPRVRTA